MNVVEIKKLLSTKIGLNKVCCVVFEIFVTEPEIGVFRLSYVKYIVHVY